MKIEKLFSPAVFARMVRKYLREKELTRDFVQFVENYKEQGEENEQ